MSQSCVQVSIASMSAKNLSSSVKGLQKSFGSSAKAAICFEVFIKICKVASEQQWTKDRTMDDPALYYLWLRQFSTDSYFKGSGSVCVLNKR